MPSLEIKTNVKLEGQAARDFTQEFSHFAADLLGKPLSYITTHYTYNETLTWHGTFDPAFVLSIVSLGNLNPEANEKYSKILFKHLEEKLGVPHNRGYIVFHDPGNSNIGHQGTHFGTIFGVL